MTPLELQMLEQARRNEADRVIQSFINPPQPPGPEMREADPFSLRQFLWQQAARREGSDFADRMVGRPYFAADRPLAVGDFLGGGIVDMADVGTRYASGEEMTGNDALAAIFGIAETLPAGFAARRLPGLLEIEPRIVGEGFAELTQNPQNRQYFAQNMSDAQDTWGPIGRSVDVYEPEDYAGMSMFMSPNADAGFVVKPDGEVASVVKRRGADFPDVSGRALRRSEPEGGNWLNAFDTAITEMYGRNNFRPVSRLPFDEGIVRSEWGDEATDAFMTANAGYSAGRPDVVFMARDPSFAGPVSAGSGGQSFSDWDDAMASLQAEMRRLGYGQ
jgi:hypothetical protein